MSRSGQPVLLATQQVFRVGSFCCGAFAVRNRNALWRWDRRNRPVSGLTWSIRLDLKAERDLASLANSFARWLIRAAAFLMDGIILPQYLQMPLQTFLSREYFECAQKNDDHCFRAFDWGGAESKSPSDAQRIKVYLSLLHHNSTGYVVNASIWVCH
jgi:hypothetical protein